MFGSFPVFGNGWQEAANASKRQHDLDIDRANLEIEQRNQEILDLEKRVALTVAVFRDKGGSSGESTRDRDPAFELEGIKAQMQA